MTSVEFHPEAERELFEAARYYEQQTPGLGEQFLAEIEKVLAVLMAHPEIGASAESGTRRAFTRRFPYGVVYLPSSAPIVIVAIAHLHRRPDYWRRRL